MKTIARKIVSLFYIVTFFNVLLPAQNLVLNPGFEVNSGICLFSGYGNLNNWYYTDTCSSPDQFATCNLLGAPGNGQGNQAPHGGQAYAGFIAYDATFAGYREYVAGELNTPLTAGVSYCVSFFISLSDNSSYAVNKVGVYFSNGKVVYNVGGDCISNPTLLPYTPQLAAPANALTDKTNWVHVKWNYVATGGEKFITIGNFYNNANSGVSNVGGTSIWAYYYIDDVSVIPGPCTATASIAQSGIPCAGQCTGTASASMASGTSPYTYLWGGGQTSQTINNLCAGTYTVTVTDALSQTATASATIAAGSSSVGATASSTNATCGNANGTATVTGSGDLAYNYSWSNSSSSQSISNLSNGTYTVTVTGQFTGCSATASVSVSVANGLTVSSSSTNAACGSNTGSATANVTAGAGPYSYTWSNSETSQTISNIGSGNYTVTVTGSGGCSATAAVSVSVSNNLAVSSSSTNAACGSNTGTATANVTAGPGPFTYAWGNNGSGQTISNLGAGTYTVTVTGAGGCTAVASATVTASSTLPVTPSSTNATCGNNNGSATISVTGGGSYTYVWSNNGLSATINNLGAGVYNVTVLGNAGCSATASVTITASAGLSLTLSSTAASCGNSNGTATINPGSGSGFTYAWSNSGATQTISGLSPGVYNVTVTGQGGCSATASVGVVPTGGLTASFTVVQPSCGNSNGSITCLGVLNGTSPISMEWKQNGIVIDTGLQITGLDSGTFVFHAVDSLGCEFDSLFSFSSVGANAVAINANQTLMCSGDAANICAPGGYAAYQWNTGDTTPCVATQLAGAYYVTVTDNGGCTATSNRLNINVHPLPPVSITVNGDTLTAFNAVGYQWYLNGTLIPGATSDVYIATQSGNYTLNVTDANGCHATSNAVSIVVTGIENTLSNETGAKVYPNPAFAESWFLEVSEALIGSNIEVFDGRGRMVYNTTIASIKTEINFKAAQGIYMMKLLTGGRALTQKLIKLNK